MPVRVVTGALIAQDRVLLVHRNPNRTWYPDVWDLPGGHREPGESSRDTLERELGEELGVAVVTADGPETLWLHDGGEGVEMDVWCVTEWRGIPINLEPAEHDALGWFRVDDLPVERLADAQYVDLLNSLALLPAPGGPGVR